MIRLRSESSWCWTSRVRDRRSTVITDRCLSCWWCRRRGTRQAAPKRLTSSRLLRVSALRAQERVSEAEVHQQAGPQAAGRPTWTQRLAGETRHGKPCSASPAGCCHLANLMARSQSYWPPILKVSWRLLQSTSRNVVNKQNSNNFYKRAIAAPRRSPTVTW